jgi:competence protein ComEC
LILAVSASGGLAFGSARLHSIDGGAYAASPGSHLTLRGNVVAVPRRSAGTVRVQVAMPAGRVAVEAPEPVPDLPIGAEVTASGTLMRPPPWLRGNLRLHGIARILRASRIELTGGRRDGVMGRVDAIRTRAEQALGRGMPDEQAALARGFVLGEDDRIPPATTEAFQRSGLAHHLAVSGENVLLLALLAAPVLAALGLTLRARLLWLLLLIGFYVPLAGGGASIQRAGVMGAAALIATLAGRPASRSYALLLAVVVTLGLNPRASSDVGWQLSFAAVVGIFVWAAPLRDRMLRGREGSGWRRGLADGVAVTIAATLATAPLMAHHFDSFSATSLPANVLALPAVAPSMWLGMTVAALGQLPLLVPVEPLNWVNSLLLAYIGQIADWMAAPDWAQVGLPMASWVSVLVTYAALLATTTVLRRVSRRRRGMRAGKLRGHRGSRSRALPRPALACLAFLLLFVAPGLLAGRLPGLGRAAGRPASGLRISVIDVGQGDAILLQPSHAPPLLVDGGPPGDDLASKLEQLGVGRLAAAVATHDESDHVGGLEELLGSLPVDRLVYADAGRRLLGEAKAAGAAPTRVAAGSELRSGGLRLQVLWPPRELLGPRPEEPNTRSLVIEARWRHFTMLLTGDAEAEAVPIDPGPIDVLKVAHHGSADAGLGELLDRSRPKVAVISVGDENPFGHPVASTLAALAAHGVEVLRTDIVGTVTIKAGASGVEAGGTD